MLRDRAPQIADELMHKFIDLGIRPTAPFTVHDQETDWTFSVKPVGEDWGDWESFSLTCEPNDADG